MAQPSKMIEFGRDVCNQFNIATRKEWLVTNGLGGFASGTVANARTRRYHGLLIAALHPPLSRTLLVSSIDETVTYNGQSFSLFSDHFISGAVEPQGYLNIERFYLDHSIPVWEFAIGDALLEKRIWMQYGENTTYIRYKSLRRDCQAIQISANVLANPRDYHGLTHANQTNFLPADAIHDGLHLAAPEFQSELNICSHQAAFIPRSEWKMNLYLSEEARRGELAVEDSLIVGSFSTNLEPGESLTVIISTQPAPCLDGQIALNNSFNYHRDLQFRASKLFQTDHPFGLPIEQLIYAADQFIASRPTEDDENGKTILAGYPWFSDWGRDTMISLPGLTLATGKSEIARSILKTFSRYVDQGMLPNRFPDLGETPEYNTADATLWFFEAIRAYLKETDDCDFLREIFPILAEIIGWHKRGTRYQIQLDPSDGLLFAGDPTTQVTWMDVKIDGWAVTPRSGKPVEINALWYNALRCMSEFASKLNLNGDEYTGMAEKAKVGFARFWDPERNYLYDVLDGPTGNDLSLRPNQLIAAAIYHSPIPFEQQKAVVDVCAQSLLTSFGLRSLAPGEPSFIPYCQGNRWQRDAAYHQGTVWGWLIGPFISAYLRVYQNTDQAWTYLQPIFNHLLDHGLGSISEIFDGIPPYTPEGCIAQAWSVAEVLRVIREIQQIKKEN